MRTLTALISSGYFLFFSAQPGAEPAVYSEGILTIDAGAVISEDSNSYFSNIRLSRGSDGKFTVISAQEQPLVSIDSVNVAIMESFPVQVSLTVAGYKSVPCVELNEAAITLDGNDFSVVLSETVLGPAESCIAVLDPFETTFNLDVLGLTAGTYTVNVNGVETEFTLEVDNSPLP